MLTLDLMKKVRLYRRPPGQLAFAYLFLGPNYALPWARTHIELEGTEHLQHEGPAIVVMNHIDRYNYWPFQYQIWRKFGIFTAIWAKGKNYNHPLMARFMNLVSNIPVPSRGYLITADAVALLGRRPTEQAYRLLRDALDRGDFDTDALLARARENGCQPQVHSLLTTPRSMLGEPFEAASENYFEAIEQRFDRMMDRFIELNEQAFELGLRVMVMPEGTRSLRLGTGRTGAAQIALRTGASIIPVGCNGSDRVYSGRGPFARGGRIVYRIGAPLRPSEELAPFQIDQAFRPFSRSAEEAYDAQFRGTTDLLMDHINELLDRRHQRSEDSKPLVSGTRRFV